MTPPQFFTPPLFFGLVPHRETRRRDRYTSFGEFREAYLPWEIYFLGGRETVGFVPYISQFGLWLDHHFACPGSRPHLPLSSLFASWFVPCFFKKKLGFYVQTFFRPWSLGGFLRICIFLWIHNLWKTATTKIFKIANKIRPKNRIFNCIHCVILWLVFFYGTRVYPPLSAEAPSSLSKRSCRRLEDFFGGNFSRFWSFEAKSKAPMYKAPPRALPRKVDTHYRT